MTAATAPTTPDRGISFNLVALRRVFRIGAVTGLTMVFIAAIGMLKTFDKRLIVDPILSLGYIALFAVPAVAGFSFSRRQTIQGIEEEPRSSTDLLTAALAGALAGGTLATYALLVESAPGLRDTFPNFSPDLIGLITFGYGTAAGFVVVTAISSAVATAAALINWLPTRLAKALVTAGLVVVSLALFEAVVDDFFDWFKALPNWLYGPTTGLTMPATAAAFVVAGAASLWASRPARSKVGATKQPKPPRSRRSTVILAIIIGTAALILPQFLGGIINELLANVGIFMLMALGLNIVIGYAGLLDLGYVAFFAVGAYTMGILTSALSPTWNPELSWWLAFPVVLIVAAIAGLMVGTPVLRMRGDYLAIVTLGFGEIVRIVLQSDWLSVYFGGAQGIRQIPGIPFAGQEISAISPELMIYFVMALVFIAAYISWRIEDSRVGRAWAALREDEDVAEAVGVDTVKVKLLAFVSGAVLASFAGALFAAKVGSIFATSFSVLVSIIVLVIVIVGGMGNITGVAVGAFVLIGILGGPRQPGLLQEFGEFKLLIYGALLVYMMLKRPEGLVPSRQRQQELHQDEYLQDAWLDKAGADEAPE